MTHPSFCKLIQRERDPVNITQCWKLCLQQSNARTLPQHLWANLTCSANFHGSGFLQLQPGPADTVSHRPDGQISALWSRTRPPDYKDFEPGTGNWAHLFLWVAWAGPGFTFSAHYYRPKEHGLSVTGNYGITGDIAWCHQFYKVRNSKLLTDRLQVCCSVRYAYTENGRRLRPSST